MSRVWCCGCLKSYSRKAEFKDHFELKEVKAEHSGKLVPNPCYGRKRKAFANTLEEAQNHKKLKPMTDIFKKTNQVEYADLADLSSCAFSEAPAEGVFSVYACVTKGRESLTVGNAVALTRVAMHGPSPSTEAAKELARTALTNYNSHLGERFCTQTWFKGKTSKTIKKQQNKKWEW